MAGVYADGQLGAFLEAVLRPSNSAVNFSGNKSRLDRLLMPISSTHKRPKYPSFQSSLSHHLHPWEQSGRYLKLRKPLPMHRQHHLRGEGVVLVVLPNTRREAQEAPGGSRWMRRSRGCLVVMTVCLRMVRLRPGERAVRVVLPDTHQEAREGSPWMGRSRGCLVAMMVCLKMAAVRVSRCLGATSLLPAQAHEVQLCRHEVLRVLANGGAHP